jgi:glycosyltransferase involved in cell wall biosynthesis
VSGRPDVLVVSLGTTKGLRVADAGFAEQLRLAGATVALAATRIGLTDRLRRGYPVNDLVEALAVRRATATAVARERPRAVVFSTTTATLLKPSLDVPYAIRFDAPAALNRPGARNRVLHLLERRRMEQAAVLVPASASAVAPLDVATPTVVVPIPVAASPSGPGDPERPPVAVAYTPDPKAKGLDLLCQAWAAAALPGARLDVYGIAPETARAFLARRGIAEPAGVRWRGMVPGEQFRAALRAAHVFVSAARWEDYGQAALEAMSDGTLPALAPAGGPFEALPLTRALDPALVAPDLAPASLATVLRHAFALPAPAVAGLRVRAAAMLRDYTTERVVERLAGDVLPLLLRG